ncbi:TauD/TfdA family dioxygenase [Luteibacter sp. 3190]|uniref:TauD/TfdA dioxygenase family protein n=1 Tax=Luteibacter sp. 3190 TaxID=2817736 RepID=UPI00285630C5|nr:TauD/TfdA family dioxygenase [Luteibacter sp. 3190]MDR6935335.1 taurine dioxygenase [Luteibacter sp. 3190]
MKQISNGPLRVASIGQFGAEIDGLDLSESLTPKIVEQLNATLATFQFIVIRRQPLCAEHQLKLTRCFGDFEPGLSRRPAAHRVAGFPDLLYLSNEIGSTTADYGMGWHSDGLAYAKKPHGATILHCLACPPGTGGTLLADQYDAYARLPESVQRRIEGMYWYLPKVPHSEVPEGKALLQPMVRVHEVTGRKFVFCSPSANRIKGLSAQQSDEIFNEVRRFQVTNANVYCHNWEAEDTLIWENSTLLHSKASPVNFFDQGLRAMHRSATSGDFEAIEESISSSD